MTANDPAPIRARPSLAIGSGLVVLAVVVAACGSAASSPTTAGSSPGRPPSSSPTAGDAPSTPTARPVPDAGKVRYGGPTHIDGAPAAYWTFDDGPEPVGTAKVLDALTATGTPATFFVLGQFMQTAAERATIKREIADGNALGAHGFRHSDMAKWDERMALAEIRRIRQEIVAQTGMRPTCFRPPYGSTSAAVEAAAGKEAMVVQMWVIDTLDWTHPGASAMAEGILRDLKPGAVILMHDGRGNGPAAAEVVRRVVPEARRRGYTFGQLCPMNPD